MFFALMAECNPTIEIHCCLGWILSFNFEHTNNWEKRQIKCDYITTQANLYNKSQQLHELAYIIIYVDHMVTPFCYGN